MWGTVLCGRSSGLTFIDPADAVGVRCGLCRSFPDDFLLAYRPRGAHLDVLSAAARRYRTASSLDGFKFFDQDTRDAFVRCGLNEGSLVDLGHGTYTFDLLEMDAIETVTLNVDKAFTCPRCGRRGNIYFRSDADDVVEIGRRPLGAFARSSELLGNLSQRGVYVYMSEETRKALEWPSSWTLTYRA